MNDRTQPRIIVAGCSPDTGNLGVSALYESTVTGVAARLPSARISVLDGGRGVRAVTLPRDPEPLVHECVGAVQTKRLYRADSWPRIRLAVRLGGLANAAAQRFLEARAVLDVSGGDSFTDLYGAWRFEAVVRPKVLALELGVPLVLLPQTYGPFKGADYRRRAAEIVRRAAVAWARDERSFEVLKELLGDSFDPARHKQGVDMAFLLEPRRPARPLPEPLAGWLDDEAVEVFGVNVSGLIFNDPAGARDRYGFRADYAEVVERLVRHMLQTGSGRVALVPHVLTPPGHYESDIEACEAVRARIGDDRVAVLPAGLDQAEIKHVIARSDWFCGTRMHSTIAALSTGVPTAAIAYSPKTLGVFETCGQGRHVADPRAAGTDAVVEALVASWEARHEGRRSLGERLPAVMDQAQEQMDHVVHAFTRHLHTESAAR